MRVILSQLSRAAAYWRSGGLGPLLVRSVSGSGAVRVAAMIVGFGVSVQLARILGVAAYGYYGLAMAIITIASIPGEMGLPRLVTREVAASATVDDMPRLFGVIRWADSIVWKMSALLGGLVIAGSIAVVTFTSSPLGWSLALGAPMILLMALSRLRGGALQGLHYIVLGQMPANLLRPIVLSLLLLVTTLSGFAIGAPAAMAMNSVAAAAAFVVAHSLLSRRMPATRPARLQQNGRLWFASSVPMALTEGMRVLQSELSILLLGLFGTASNVGLFRIALTCGTAAATAIPIVNHVAFPIIARLYAQQDMGSLQKVVTRLAQAQALGTLALALPLLVAAEPLIRIAFGADFVPAADVVRIVAAAQLVNACFGPNAALLNMTNHERRVTKAMSLALVINLAAVMLLGAMAGLVGVAAGLFLGLLWWNVATWLDARRLLNIETSIVPRRWAGLPNEA